jgi:chemotaxis protein histidine kinase CheA
MDELRQIYRNALPPHIEVLEVARSAGYDDASARAVRRVAHTLRGSGGTYGFPDVSAAAAAVEDADTATFAAAVDDLIELLRATAGSAQ